MQQYRVNKKYNIDLDFYGYKMRTRVRYYDEKILKDELNPETNIYRIPKSPKIVIDIGAHIGGTTIRCAKMGAIVYSYEPEYDNYNTLCYNINNNKLSDNVYTFNVGVGKSGLQKLYIHDKMSGTTSSYLTQKGLEENKCQEVNFITIDNVLSNIKFCDLLKLDCEGSENDIIRDFTKEMAEKVNQISVEFHDKKIMQELINILSKWYDTENTRRYEWVFFKK